jgi:hypothetical protein
MAEKDSVLKNLAEEDTPEIKKRLLELKSKLKKTTSKKTKAKKKLVAKKPEAKKKIVAKKPEAKKAEVEPEVPKTYEEELEEKLTLEEITGFQISRTDMDKLINKVCEIVAIYETKGMLQSELWKKLKLSSRDGSRLALKLEKLGMITREKILEKGRWTYKLIIKKIPVTLKSIVGAPCLVCPVESKCTIDGEVSPRTCQLIEDWVFLELKTSKSK